jgi:hypothetical protein
VEVIRTAGYQVKEQRMGIRGSGKQENSRSGKQENGEFRIGPCEIMLCISRGKGRDLLLKC